jgi:hypothetical protein
MRFAAAWSNRKSLASEEASYKEGRSETFAMDEVF